MPWIYCMSAWLPGLVIMNLTINFGEHAAVFIQVFSFLAVWGALAEASR